MTQEQEILVHMKEVGPITAIQALTAYGVMRLAARINTLRDKGYGIITEYHTKQIRPGKTVKYAKYRLVQ